MYTKKHVDKIEIRQTNTIQARLKIIINTLVLLSQTMMRKRDVSVNKYNPFFKVIRQMFSSICDVENVKCQNYQYLSLPLNILLYSVVLKLHRSLALQLVFSLGLNKDKTLYILHTIPYHTYRFFMFDTIVILQTVRHTKSVKLPKRCTF